MGKLAPKALIARLREAFSTGNYQEAWNICQSNKLFPQQRAWRGAWSASGAARTRSSSRSRRPPCASRPYLRTNTTYLSVIGVVSPMIGLTGTVWGMIKAFHTLGQNGITDPSKLAGNIGEVLVATASGLIVAIPAFVFYLHPARTAAGRDPLLRGRRSTACSTRCPTSSSWACASARTSPPTRPASFAPPAPARRRRFPARSRPTAPPATRRSTSAPRRARIAARCSTGAASRSAGPFHGLQRQQTIPQPQAPGAGGARARIPGRADDRRAAGADAFLHEHHLDRAAQEGQEPAAARRRQLEAKDPTRRTRRVRS